MKVKELIAELSVRDPELEVLVHGADGGLSDIAKAEQVFVIFGACSGGWCGPHHEDYYVSAYDPEDYPKNAKQGTALILRRK